MRVWNHLNCDIAHLSMKRIWNGAAKQLRRNLMEHLYASQISVLAVVI